jgi:hypothetical protein
MKRPLKEKTEGDPDRSYEVGPADPDIDRSKAALQRNKDAKLGFPSSRRHRLSIALVMTSSQLLFKLVPLDFEVEVGVGFYGQ